jgi:PAS domain S-box-containing protein
MAELDPARVRSRPADPDFPDADQSPEPADAPVRSRLQGRSLNPAAAAATAVRGDLAKVFLVATSAACAAAVPVILLNLGKGEAPRLSAMGFGAVALFCLVSIRLPLPQLRVALTLSQVGAMLAVVGSGVALGWGLAAPAMPLLGLMVFSLAAAAGWPAAVLLFTLTVAMVLAVDLEWVPIPRAVAPPPPPGLQLAVLLITIGAGLLAGVALWRRLLRTKRSVLDREHRFQRLLSLAVDGYWEIDQHYHLVAAADRGGQLRPWVNASDPPSGPGRAPWELPQWSSDPEALDALLADLDNRQPFHDMPVRWQRKGGSVHHFLASGEPRFDQRDIFTGYWGVVRDITEQHRAQAELAATETRYRELFSRIPTPLVLHRGGVVLDANAAALALFDQPDLESMVGTDLLASYESGDSRERARRRVDLLHGQPLGTALPVTDYKLQLPRRRVSVRATSVRVDAQGGPASLAIFVDDTDRLAAEEAVRRSEAMLSHLVATSPDLITLTEMASGRYTMVNRSFERISGWTAAEVVGRTAIELGVWGSTGVRDDFVRQVRERGSVTDLPVPFVNKQGRTFSMVVSAAVFVLDNRDYLVINARDVTEKERERLEREAILLNASIGIAVTRQRTVVLVNRHFEQMFGWAPGELTGQGTAVLWQSALDYAEAGSSASAALARGEAVEMERSARRKDGSTFTARIRGRSVDPARPLEGGAIWIVEDVTERRQFEQTLARARDAAEAASHAKSAFLANTSHELRTPLNALIGLARLARGASLDATRRSQYLVQIEQSAKSLEAIISDILDLSRIEAGKLRVERAAFDLAAELQGLHTACSALAEARGLKLHLELDASMHGPVQGDALRVRQIANNFLVNAIKFTESGSIWLRAWRPGGRQHARVRIEVQDTGPGIAPDTLARLFKPFTQADESITRRYGGTGLGLSICHELAELMQGVVGASSREGQGSVFWVELPMPALPTTSPGAPAALAARPPQQSLSAATAEVAEGAHDLSGIRVLMAEDNSVNMMIAAAMLELWGVAVTQAADGREAVAAVVEAEAASLPFDAVLMDVQMPVLSGYEATRALRQREAGRGGPTLPIIALTAAALNTERDQALAAGMDDFLTKPIDADKLHAALRRWCRRAVR